MKENNYPEKENQNACEGISEEMIQQISGEDLVSKNIENASIQKSCHQIKDQQHSEQQDSGADARG